MKNAATFKSEIELIENVYCIVDCSTAEVVNKNDEPVGDYSYEEIELPLLNNDCGLELVVDSIHIDEDALYTENELESLKYMLQTLQQNADDDQDYNILKLSRKAYYYTSIEEIQDE